MVIHAVGILIQKLAIPDKTIFAFQCQSDEDEFETIFYNHFLDDVFAGIINFGLFVP